VRRVRDFVVKITAHDEVMYYAVIAATLARKKKAKKTSLVKIMVASKHQYLHINLLAELQFHLQDWHNYLRVNEENNLTLLSMVIPKTGGEKKKYLYEAGHTSL
jgi:hypothetical protein